MQNLAKLRSFSVGLCACVALLAGSQSTAQHVHVGYAGGWHGGYGWRGGYYGGWRGYYGGWRYPYYGWGWYGGYYPWGWPGYWAGYWPYAYYGSPYYGSPYYYPAYAGQYDISSHPEMAQGGASPGPASQPQVEPRNGQSQELQGRDAFECHRWAVGQTGFDPTLGTPGNRSGYFRAQAACLEGRGYTVK